MVVKRGTMPKKLSKPSIKKNIKKVKGKAGKKINKRNPATAQVSVKSTPSPSKPKKRVSFAKALEQSKIIGDLLAPELPESFETPTTTKSILRKKLESSAGSSVQKISSNAEAVETEAKDEEFFSETVSESLPKTEKKLHKVKTGKSQNKTGASIKKSTKEIMAQMNKQERKAFLLTLAEKKKNYPIMKEAKLLWETLRSSKCKGAEKEELLNKLMNVVSGNAKEIIFSHSASRVIQFLVTQKKETIRNELFEELTPEIVRMAKSKYAKFFVAKMLKYGSKHQRDLVLNAFQGHCVSLFKISTAAQLLDTAFNEYANAAQRFSIVSEFYGPEYVLFKHELGDLTSLKQIAQKQPEKVVPIMQNLENVLENCVIKETLKLSLTHRLLLDYLTYCNKDQKSSIIESMRTNIPEICHTRDGSRAALECIWSASVKDRKAIVKSFKGLAVKSAMDEFARRALFAIFDVVDDTVLVNKIITEEIGNNIAEVVYDKFGVWVLHYLVHPRDGRVLGKGMVEILSQGDSNEYSQKRPSERYTELFNCIRTPLYTFLAANMKEVITNKISSVLVLDALEPDAPMSPLKKVIDESDKQACFAAIAQIVGEEFIPNNIEGEPHIIESGCQRFVFRKLLQCDASQEGVKLSDLLADLPAEHLQSFIGVNSGCFALVDMLRSGSSKARTAITNAVSLTSLKNSTLVGAKALLEVLTNDENRKPSAK